MAGPLESSRDVTPVSEAATAATPPKVRQPQLPGLVLGVFLSDLAMCVMMLLYGVWLFLNLMELRMFQTPAGTMWLWELMMAVGAAVFGAVADFGILSRKRWGLPLGGVAATFSSAATMSWGDGSMVSDASSGSALAIAATLVRLVWLAVYVIGLVRFATWMRDQDAKKPGPKKK